VIFKQKMKERRRAVTVTVGPNSNQVECE